MTFQCGGRAEVAREAHNLEVVGSIPTPATNSRRDHTPLKASGFRGNFGNVAALLGRFLPKLGRAAAKNSPATFVTNTHTDIPYTD